MRRVINWAKISGAEVLEGPTEHPGSYMPVFAVVGDEGQVNGRLKRCGVIRYAKDAQQIYNYARSTEAEFAALQPKAPYLVTLKQVQGHERFWNTANQSNYPYLPYEPDPRAPGAPQRAQPPVSSQALAMLAQSAMDDMRATTGIYDAALGAKSNETSGVAIRQRQVEADSATSVYADNMTKAILAAGRCLVDMIPKVYDSQRLLRVLSRDDKEEMIEVNKVEDAGDGVERLVNDLTVGKYDVRLTVGPSYKTERQEVRDGMLGFVQAFPNAAAVTSDLVAEAMDWPKADRFAERLRKTLPPELREETEDANDPAAMQARQAAQEQAAKQAQMAEAMMQTQMKKADAEANEAVADAEKAKFEAEEKQLEVAAKSGSLDAALAEVIQAEVGRALQQIMGR
jgi:hypothetical protein